MRRWLMILLVIACILPMKNVSAEDIVRLTWQPIVGAVLYEVSLTADANGDEVLWQDTCSANGIELDADVIDARYYRIRAIDYDHQVQGQEVIVGSLRKAPRADGVPYILFEGREDTPIYPVYTWIPVYDAVGYEIEVATHKMRSRYISARGARKITVTGKSVFDYYDDEPLLVADGYWYRVRALYDNDRHSAWSRAVYLQGRREAYYGAIGDSITHGGGSITHTPNELSYTWLNYTERSIVNLGMSGDTAADIAERTAQEASCCGVKVLFIMGGINDLRAGESAQNVIRELSRAANEARKAGIRPILLTVTPCNPLLMTERMGYPLAPSWQTEWRKVNDWIRMQEDSVDVSGAVTDESGYLDGSLTTDGLHPDAQGKRKIGEALRDYLNEHKMP